jgi:hypothetical protein
MKTFSIFMILLASASGFSPLKQPTLQSTTSLNAKPIKWTPAAAAATLLLGFTLASPLPSVADGTSLDFALPSYDTKMRGFGEGTEARLTSAGASEKEKQTVAMRKAEEARQEQLQKKKAEVKERQEEDKRRALEKKARDADRLKNIWN